MEQYIRDGKVIFPKLEDERVVTWKTKKELLDAIDRGDVPLRPKNKTPLITRDLPDLDFWIGRPVGFGRPWFKRHLSDLQSEVRPVSSWIRGASEDEFLDEFSVGLVSQRSGTGEHSVNEILGFNAFPFPKPLSLIKNLLQQATRPNDIVLDFFAGSGTTGQAVLELNAEDGGQRRFILCSSTEATAKEPDKNLCRDVCAERMRRVIAGYGGKPGFTPEQGGAFAYLRLDTLPTADAVFDVSAEQAFQLLALRRLGAALSLPADLSESSIALIGRVGDCDVLLCADLSAETLAQLAAWPSRTGAARLAVYTLRPRTLAERLDELGVPVNAYSLMDAVMTGQGGDLA
jgi:adenine-specific DNA-methyltransferase